jgi:protein disulfide-isomerase
LRRAIPGAWERKIAALAVRCTALARRCNHIEGDDVKTHRLISLIAAVFFSGQFAFAEPGWLNDYKKAQEEAKANKKFLLLDFTGSDWCGWCIKFDKEVLSQPQFKDYARDNLVLVELDFPRRKQQSAELQKQNRELAQHYEVFGFPTIIVLNSDGQKLWQFDGYFPGGPEAFIAQLQKLRKG